MDSDNSLWFKSHVCMYVRRREKEGDCRRGERKIRKRKAKETDPVYNARGIGKKRERK